MKMETELKPFILGQAAKSLFNGWGVVTEVREGFKYPIIVRFYDCTLEFTQDGKAYEDDLVPTLYHDEVKVG